MIGWIRMHLYNSYIIHISLYLLYLTQASFDEFYSRYQYHDGSIYLVFALYKTTNKCKSIRRHASSSLQTRIMSNIFSEHSYACPPNGREAVENVQQVIRATIKTTSAADGEVVEESVFDQEFEVVGDWTHDEIVSEMPMPEPTMISPALPIWSTALQPVSTVAPSLTLTLDTLVTEEYLGEHIGDWMAPTVPMSSMLPSSTPTTHTTLPVASTLSFLSAALPASTTYVSTMPTTKPPSYSLSVPHALLSPSLSSEFMDFGPREMDDDEEYFSDQRDKINDLMSPTLTAPTLLTPLTLTTHTLQSPTSSTIPVSSSMHAHGGFDTNGWYTWQFSCSTYIISIFFVVFVSDPLRYEFAPGARYGSVLIYTLDEKQMYRRQNVCANYDRYTCNTRGTGCKVVLRLSKPGNVARKSGKQRVHNHVQVENTCTKNRFSEAVKAACMASKGRVNVQSLYDQQRER